jgi:hypothetical protein
MNAQSDSEALSMCVVIIQSEINVRQKTDRLAFEGVVLLQDYFDRLYGSPVVCPYYLMPILPSLLKGWPPTTYDSIHHFRSTHKP